VTTVPLLGNWSAGTGRGASISIAAPGEGWPGGGAANRGPAVKPRIRKVAEGFKRMFDIQVGWLNIS
jgi:hypothetical protein